MVDFNGRNGDGTFAKGFKGGPGNPFAKRSNAIRALLYQECTDAELKKIIKKLISMAKKGNLDAIKQVFNRTLGKVPDCLTMGADEEQNTTPRRVVLVDYQKADAN